MPIDPNLTLLVIALCNLVTAVLTWRSHRAVKETQVNVQKIETATNSMKDALVARTGEAAHAAGLEEGRAAGAVTAATLARGQLHQTEK